jgi:dTDP-4-dehydrorhamnose 3,5-epimerase
VIFTETRLAGAYILDLQRFDDDRGYFARVFCQREFEAHGLNASVAQANVAYNARRGTLRGMHFQFPPFAETKVVRATRGAVLDIIVDLRPESPTYLEHISVELSVATGRSLYVPERFAHGYQVLEDDTEVSYHMGEFYAPDAACGLSYCDPSLGLSWPLPITAISPRDATWQPLSEVEGELRRRMTCQNTILRAKNASA